MIPAWLASPPPDVAIEIAPDRVTAVVASLRGGKVTVTAHATEALPSGAVVPSLTEANVPGLDDVSEAVGRVCQRLPSRPRRVALVIPDGAAKVSLLSFDSVPRRPDDLDRLVRWQIKKSAPFPIDDACVTYMPGRSVGAVGREFLVATARREVVSEYEAACAAAGAHAGLVDLTTFSLANLYLGSPAVPEGDWLLVHVRPTSTSIAILRGRDVIFYRNRVESEGVSLADLVHQTAMYYQDRLSGAGFSLVLVAGTPRGVGGVERVRRDVEERLGCVVELVDMGRVSAGVGGVAVPVEQMDLIAPPVGILVRGFRLEGRA